MKPRTPQTSITSLPPSPTDERHSRMVKYSIAMGIRMVCIALLFVVPGWWVAVFAVGAIVLPYLAVVLANVGSPAENGIVERPGGIVPLNYPAPGYDVPTAAASEAGTSEPGASGQGPSELGSNTPPEQEKPAA